MFACGNMIRYNLTLVDLTSNLFILCSNVKLNFFIFLRGWSLALISTLINVRINNVKQLEDSMMIKAAER